MAKISMLIPDADLALIDEQAKGNRTAFMLAAALERVRQLKHACEDQEITSAIEANEPLDGAVSADWESTVADGLD